MIAGFNNKEYTIDTIQDIKQYLTQEAGLTLPCLWNNDMYGNSGNRYGNFKYASEDIKVSTTAYAIYHRYDMRINNTALNYISVYEDRDTPEIVEDIVTLIGENSMYYTAGVLHFETAYDSVDAKGHFIEAAARTHTTITRVDDDIKQLYDYLLKSSSYDNPADVDIFTMGNTLVFYTKTATPSKEYSPRNRGLEHADWYTLMQARFGYCIIPAVYKEEVGKQLPDWATEYFANNCTPLGATDHQTKQAGLHLIVENSIYWHYLDNKERTDFLNVMYTQRKQAAKRAVKDVQTSLDELERQLNSKYADLLGAQRKLLQLEVQPEQELIDAINYIYDHPYLTKVKSSRKVTTIQGVVPITQWEEDVLELLLNNKRDEFNAAAEFDICRLLTDLFIEQEAEYLVFAAFTIDASMQRTEVWTSSAYSCNELPDNVQAGINPHIYYYGCLGTYAQQISKAKSQNDFILLIESFLSAHKNINFADTPVVTRYREYLTKAHYYGYPCIKRDGEVMSIKDYINKYWEDNTDEEEINELELEDVFSEG